MDKLKCAYSMESERQEILVQLAGIECEDLGCVDDVGDLPADAYCLYYSAGRLELLKTGKRRPVSISVDFDDPRMRHRRRGGHGELLTRACGISLHRRLHVLDATAGLGRDAFVLADAGAIVTMCERQAEVACLLENGLYRALQDPENWPGAACKNMSLRRGDCRELFKQGAAMGADVVYLDPMFPSSGKAAAAKKEMQMLRELFPSSVDSAALLEWALGVARIRVVVKRAIKSPPIDGRGASFSLDGRAVRYDVYALQSLPAIGEDASPLL